MADPSIVKHSTADPATYLDCPQSYKYYEFHNKKHWLWTSYLSYNCFAVVLTSKQAVAFWHQPSKWEDEADRSLRSDPFKSFLQPLLDDIKTWFRKDAEARAFKENPGDLFTTGHLFVIKPTHGYGQEEAIKWFTAALKDEFRIEPTVATFAPSNPDRILGWATAEVCYDPNDSEYDSTGEKNIKMPRVYVNKSEVRPVAQPVKPQPSPQPKPPPRPAPPLYPWTTASSSSSQQAPTSDIGAARQRSSAKKTAHQQLNPYRR